ncbi:UDP-N-acetylmuramoyl-L-alanyl-D-glutamate--2,6-diaminopimelate ligase [Dokdonella sp.]|uniref:UDP-N-acetylmuramoyl-L-alanyl-D-glutamate--2, 6-diaminopimelate ligase n=1 Tax=Dokdonella sp. TaxID=2291710 RepID=UPI00260DF919|nr:UDP-N-acetylmuramoyl-L-alanyl-D-glutamate--2,6-diaminopimelate ligase [Dokdonella sp.]
MSRPDITLRELLQDRADTGTAGGIVVHGLALDSRRVRPGDAFVALGGTQMHGLAFVPAAIERGAVAVLAEAPGQRQDAESVVPAGAAAVPTVWVANLRSELGAIASRCFGEPSRALDVIGVTGTNGKTSTVQMLAQALHRLGRSSATIGTLGAGLHGAIREGERTTPDAIAVHGLLAQFRDEGATHVAMEVSSHALVQGRVNAVAFDIAVFTNLTRDHLDYHGTMEAYGAAKQRLFAWPDLSAAVLNVDDAFGRALATTVGAGVRLLRYGIDRDDADVVARGVETRAEGLAFRLVTPWGEGEVATRLLGRFNVSNLLAVAACLGQLGFAFDEIRSALAALDPVAGRMNRLGGSDAQPLVVIDYAHTPDALEQALASLRAHCAGRLICVFGCGGERDAGKRPQMGAIAEALADRIVITDDNPRGEDGDAIVAQIAAGLAHPQDATVERDRAGAISLAIATAKPGDIVLIAGKGHEPYQEVAGRKQPFDDLAVARRVLEMRPC